MVGVTPRRGFVSKVAAALGLSGSQDVRVAWAEPLDERSGESVGRTLELDLSGLSEGQYSLSVAVRGADGEVATVSREVELIGGR